MDDFVNRFNEFLYLGLAVVAWAITMVFIALYATAMDLGTEVISIALTIAFFTAGAFFFAAFVYRIGMSPVEITARIEAAEVKAAAQPEKAKPAWDVAKVTLESYFNRNLAQIRYIFVISIVVILVGFGIIAWGIVRAIQYPDDALPAAIATGAGVIVEIIGATLLKMYQSSINQAMSYTEILERINAVGMAMQILDTMNAGASENNLKDKVKADIIRSLMTQNASTYSIE